EGVAARLRGPEAEILRGEYRANGVAVDASRDAYRKARDDVRQTLRVDPFDSGAMRAAMISTRATRQNFDQLLQDVIASAAAKMSAAGRSKLASWPTGSLRPGAASR